MESPILINPSNSLKKIRNMPNSLIQNYTISILLENMFYRHTKKPPNSNQEILSKYLYRYRIEKNSI